MIYSQRPKIVSSRRYLSFNFTSGAIQVRFCEDFRFHRIVRQQVSVTSTRSTSLTIAHRLPVVFETLAKRLYWPLHWPNRSTVRTFPVSHNRPTMLSRRIRHWKGELRVNARGFTVAYDFKRYDPARRFEKNSRKMTLTDFFMLVEPINRYRD